MVADACDFSIRKEVEMGGSGLQCQPGLHKCLGQQTTAKQIFFKDILSKTSKRVREETCNNVKTNSIKNGQEA